MSTEVEQARAAAAAAALQSDRYGELLGMAALIRAVQETAPAPVVLPAPVPARASSGRWVAIGAGVIVGGSVLTALLLAVALVAVAIGIAAPVMLILVREVIRGGKR